MDFYDNEKKAYRPTLCLHLKKQWYEMIDRGEKTEEYREIKPYWEKRLWCPYMQEGYCGNKCKGCKNMIYELVEFFLGFTHKTMVFEIEDLNIGSGKPEWGAPDNLVYIIKLGKRLK